MTSLSSIAYPYAKALFELVINKEADQLDKYVEDLALLKEAIINKEMISLLKNPSFSQEQKTSLLLSIVNKPHDVEVNFLKLLVQNARLEILPKVYDLFLDMVTQKRSQLTATIESAFELSDEHKNNIKQMLLKRFNKEVIINVIINPDLIGGVRIFIKDQIIDASIKGSLQKMAMLLSV